MKDFSGEDFIHLPVPASMYAAVCAVIAGGVIAAPVRGSTASEAGTRESVSKSNDAPNAAPVADASSTGDIAGAASGDTGEVDTGGHPWSETLHASTKTKTKDGYWRMKVGVARPADLPGFPQSDGTTSTANSGAASETPASATGANAGAAEEDDEFAAFRNAAANGAVTDAAAASSVPARKWTDADLSALCNQAATKLNDPAPIKEVIADFIAEGVVPHSRNIADDQRENFAKALEAKAGITFAG